MEAMSFYELLGIPETGTLGEIKQAYKQWMGFIYCLCYICLVEYEEGDSVRILPCHHEFHRPCIDKWLKEIHRICPLCRGDICRSDSLPIEN